MTYFVEGLLKLTPEESRVRRFGEYETLDAAIAAAEKMIDEFLVTRVEAGMTAQDLFSIYRESGEIPFIFLDGDRTLNVSSFNHFKHAMVRCNAMCQHGHPPISGDESILPNASVAKATGQQMFVRSGC